MRKAMLMAMLACALIASGCATGGKCSGACKAGKPCTGQCKVAKQCAKCGAGPCQCK